MKWAASIAGPYPVSITAVPSHLAHMTSFQGNGRGSLRDSIHLEAALGLCWNKGGGNAALA